MFSVNTVVYADTLNEAIIAANCSDSDDASCNGECTQTSNIITIETTGDNAGGVSDKDSGKAKDSCNEKPDEYRITFYKAGLCETDPYDATATLNPTISKPEGNCYNFFVDEAGKAISLAYDATTNSITQTGNLITGSLNFELGTYNYAYVIVDNRLEVKHQQTYSKVMKGGDTGDTFFSSGVTCWTNGVTTTFTNATGAQRGFSDLQVKDFGTDSQVKGSDATASLAMDCGDTYEASPVFNTEIIENFADAPGDENSNFVSNTGQSYESFNGTVDSAAAKLLKDDDLTTANSYLTAARIFYPIRFATPLIVTRETSVFEMSFGVSGSVSLDFSSDGANKLIAIKAGADPFTMKFTTR